MDHILYFPTHRELKELQGRHTLDVYSDFVLADKHCWVSSSQETVESKNKKTNMFFPTDIQRGITKILGSCQWVAEFLSSRGRLQPFSDRFHNNATTKAGLYRACIFTTFQAAAGEKKKKTAACQHCNTKRVVTVQMIMLRSVRLVEGDKDQVFCLKSLCINRRQSTEAEQNNDAKFLPWKGNVNEAHELSLSSLNVDSICLCG